MQAVSGRSITRWLRPPRMCAGPAPSDPFAYEMLTGSCTIQQQSGTGMGPGCAPAGPKVTHRAP
jgi:hypothetical protein